MGNSSVKKEKNECVGNAERLYFLWPRSPSLIRLFLFSIYRREGRQPAVAEYKEELEIDIELQVTRLIFEELSHRAEIYNK